MFRDDRQEHQVRLSRISTRWTTFFQAHASADGAVTAQHALVQRYSGAVFRYLLGALRDEDAAEELTQEFALRFLRGDFRRADPQRGRFRDYLKTALINLVNDHLRDRQRQPGRLDSDSPAPSERESETDFLAGWREELLERTWRALNQANAHYHAVLRFRIVNPDLSSAELAEQLSISGGRHLTAASVRKTLQRAHDKYADLLIEEVSVSLEHPTLALLEQELKELDLMKYCRPAFQRRKERASPLLEDF
jgi:RNA polymerase sigma-70 factor (ECF subfamily)